MFQLKFLIPRAACRAGTVRSYATVGGILQPERARQVLANPKRTRRGNPVDLRRLFLFEQYQEVLSSRAVFVMQNNNLTAQEYSALKSDFREKGFVIATIRNNIFGAVIRDRAASLKAAEGNEGDLRKLEMLLAGPCCVAFSNATDEDRPTLAKDFTEVAKKYKSKLLVVGAKFDGGVLTADLLSEVVKLPSLGQLRAELAGILSQPAQTLVGLLQRSPQTLLSTLKQHEENLQGGSGKDAN
ncbi:uncharacterized protein SPPG_03467 [Spizellomyces punctatus DAOM BR117]|uniref:Ribosomal protein L10 n=1 Tax=Spizellomyces punctatus (strain DAOM BR117) TaxID=645134 RepID=A0A0L0HKQ1_SPIPD|nr:uncharacterized protein SPPG_03467 [Spizellomyces punctatus DAOM BR117]KND01672.1 hypothetical protein SPPG_03467 [Spizellomyces punctatus DAOM BR117]|eukprot:XP_016609711.1 hypothetical protein SPPG_03467 [Spizellomyces punctatus DAOM BR117]